MEVALSAGVLTADYRGAVMEAGGLVWDWERVSGWD